MPTKSWSEIIETADKTAREKFAEEVSGVIKLTKDEIEEVIPPQIDHKKFAELMNLVNDSTKENNEKAEAIRNISGFAEIAVNLLSKFL